MLYYSLFNSITRDGAVAARLAHNQEVVGSSPTPATKKSTRPCDGYFSWLHIRAQFYDRDLHDRYRSRWYDN